MPSMRAIAVICTYNEAENIGELIREILLQNPAFEALVVDDDSPDGTGAVVAELARADGRVELLTRKEKRGRGLAGIAGFRRALEKGADVVVEMDGDFSHRPEYLPAFLEKIRSCDVVIGSRFVRGGGERGRGLSRRLISRFANLYIRLVLGTGVSDCSSGFRCFRREVLARMPWDRIDSSGPSLVEEILYHCRRQGFRIEEIPIIFEERRKGKSKLSLFKLIATFTKISTLRLKK